jgi:hypothetical protein
LKDKGGFVSIQSTSAYRAQNYGLMALPPWAQEEREKSAIIKDERLAHLLQGKLVASVERLEDSNTRAYVVALDSGESFIVNVEYKAAENGICGPAIFELLFPDSI